jgi:hypothetical protein
MSCRARRTIGLVVATVVVAVGVLSPPWAWARFGTKGAETNTFATHVLGTPPASSCGGLGILSVTLSWTAPADAAYVLSYELGQSSTSGGPYSYTNVGNVLTKTLSISSGNTYFVVRTVNHNWVGSGVSPERHVVGILFLAATCS